MKHILLTRAQRKAVPIALVTSKNFANWLKRQPKATKAWLDTLAYSAKPGSFCVIPDKNGKATHVVASLSDPVSMWDLSGLPRCLPKGVYTLVGELEESAQEKIALGWLLGTYRYSRYKKSQKDFAQLAAGSKIDLAKIENMAEAIVMARDLINSPPNELGPSEIAQAVVEIGKKHKAKIKQTVGNDLLKGFAAIHAVGRASVKNPRLVDLAWGNPKHPKVTLIGKGITFDTGGLDIKSSSNMLQMKKDMGGAASALAVASLIMNNKLPVRLRLLIPTAENAIGGDAYRPSDVIKMRNGLTVEIGNTDAEGRLLLAEALALASEEKPDLIIDLSTLTGAARSTLGMQIGAMFANNDDLADGLMEASMETEDYLWRLPLFEAYESMIDSQVADISSSANSPYAGTITAALFLQRFVGKNQPWAHLDFGAWNTSSKPGRPEGGEAMGVRAVYRLIENLAQKP